MKKLRKVRSTRMDTVQAYCGCLGCRPCPRPAAAAAQQNLIVTPMQ